MGNLFTAPSPPPPSPVVAQAQSAASKAAEEKAKLDQQQADEEDAIRRGIRGRKALLGSEGELGYSNTGIA